MMGPSGLAVLITRSSLAVIRIAITFASSPSLALIRSPACSALFLIIRYEALRFRFASDIAGHLQQMITPGSFVHVHGDGRRDFLEFVQLISRIYRIDENIIRLAGQQRFHIRISHYPVLDHAIQLIFDMREEVLDIAADNRAYRLDAKRQQIVR